MDLEFDEIIKGFEALDSSDQHKEVYAYFGAALFFAQILDQQALNMICIKRAINKEVTSKEEVDALWDKYEFGNRTLGMLVNEIKQLYDLKEETALEFQRILKQRNYIVHDYFRFNSHLFYSEKGMKRMIKDFVEFRNHIDKLNKNLESYFYHYRHQINLTDELLEKLMNDLMEEGKNVNADEYKTFKK